MDAAADLRRSRARAQNDSSERAPFAEPRILLARSVETRGLGNRRLQRGAHDLARRIARNGLQDHHAKGAQLLVLEGLVETGEELGMVVPHARECPVNLLAGVAVGAGA